MRPLIASGLLIGLCATVPAAAPHQPDRQQPTISVETDLVMLPVTVVDRRGRFVADLSPDQFTVIDNGDPRPIQFFNSEEMPATVGLVVDCSGSMRARRADVTAAATAFIEAAHPLDELFSIDFNESAWPGLPAGTLFTSNTDELHRALARAPTVGMTALYDAVHLAMDRLERGTRDRKALIVISDGGDNASTSTMASVLERARRADAVIYAIMLPDPNDHEARPAVLKTLARETGGAAFMPNDASSVNESFARIAGELRSGYMLGFSPPSDIPSGYRTIRVEVRGVDRGVVVRTRGGYYASGNRAVTP